MAIPAIWVGAIVYANLITMLSIGFTLTYMTAKIPNFAHGTYVGVGIYVSYTMTRIFHLNPYVTLPVSFVVGGLIGVLTYRFIVVILGRIGGTDVSLTIATIAIGIIFTSLLYIYAYYLRSLYKTYTTQFLLKNLDFKFAGMPGVFIVSSCINIIFIFSLHYFLTKIKTGIAMRATCDNPNLAQIVGINTDRVQSLSWFLSSGIASIAGAILPLWFQGSPVTGTAMITTIMAGSILGGFNSIYGAVLGGFTIGFSEIIFVRFLQEIFGSWIGEWRPIFPMLILNLVLLVESNGLYGLYIKYIENRIKQFK